MKKEKMNDKGFSLVELIIVIAIMAVLVVVLAPQYLKYVEKSRNSTDLSNATAIVTALQVYAADPDATVPLKKDEVITIKVASDKGEVTADNAGKAGEAALKNASIEVSDIKCKSKSKWTYYQISAKVEESGSLKFTYSCDTGDAFEKAMSGENTTTSGGTGAGGTT